MENNKKLFTLILLKPYLLCLIAMCMINARGCFDSSSTTDNEGEVVTSSILWLKDIVYNGVDENHQELFSDVSSAHYSLSPESGEYIKNYLRFVTYYEPQSSFDQVDVNHWILENEDYCYLTDTLGNTLDKVQINTNNNVGLNNGIVFEVHIKTGVIITTHVQVKLHCYQKNENPNLPDKYRSEGAIDIYNKKVVDFSGLTGRKIHVVIDPNSPNTSNFNCELIANDLKSWFNIIYKQGIAEMDSATICTTKVNFDVNQNGFLDFFIPSTDVNIEEDSIFEDEAYFDLDDGNIFYFRKYRFCYPLFLDATSGDTSLVLMEDTVANHLNIGDVLDISTEDDSKKETIVVEGFDVIDLRMVYVLDPLQNNYKAAEGENSCVVHEPVGYSLKSNVGGNNYNYVIVNDIFHNDEVEAYKSINHEMGHNEFGLLDLAHEKDTANLMYFAQSWYDTIPVLGYYDLRAVDSTSQKQWDEIH